MASSAAPRAVGILPLRAGDRAVGIVRVSEVGDRSGPSFRSPGEQLTTMGNHCLLKRYRLVANFEELDVSGYSIQEVDKRIHGLLPAVQMIERGEADILLLPYLDRLARNLKLFRQVVRRVKAAGGRIEAVDFGDVTGETAAQRFSVETLVHVAEFLAELTAEKTGKAQRDAIAEGIPLVGRIPVGLRKDPETRRLVVFEPEAELVREAFRMREAGNSLESIRDWLKTEGRRINSEKAMRMNIRGVQRLLAQRMYLGELHHGKLVNLHACEPIVDPGLFKTVQGMRVARGKQARSSRLLARLGIVRCASCDYAMVVAPRSVYTNKQGERVVLEYYGCSGMHVCPRRVFISASLLEELVVAYVKQADAEGHASADQEIDAAEAVFRAAEAELSQYVTLLSGLQDLAATQAKLAELQACRLEAYEHWQALRAARGTAGLRAADWDRLDTGDRRALIRATIKRVVVSPSSAPGLHSPDRVRIEPFQQ
jgi:DNA invertase Pin-like site-specific DNA recombinase